MIEQFYRKMLWVGAYPLLLALMAGATWVDRIYAHALRNTSADGLLAVAAGRVADRLLGLSAVVLVAGVLAAWMLNGVARWLVVVSLAVFSLEFLLPVMVALVPGGATYIAMLGPGLRVGIMLAALTLALYGTRRALS